MIRQYLGVRLATGTHALALASLVVAGEGGMWTICVLCFVSSGMGRIGVLCFGQFFELGRGFL